MARMTGWQRLVPGMAVSLACVSPLGVAMTVQAQAAAQGNPEDSLEPLELSGTDIRRVTSAFSIVPVDNDALQSALAGRAARLDRLHAMLLDADSELEGEAVAGQIWALWLSHPDPDIDALMKEVLEARRSQRFELAIELLDRLVVQMPDYAEGWNQRATIRYLMGDYEASLQDIAQTLAREPRHFGALSGRGMVRLQQGREALAWQSFEAARHVHPWIASRNLVPPEGRETRT